MDEKKWINKIKDSAENVEVPGSLNPESMEELLRNVKQKPKKSKLLLYSRRLGAVAAAALVLGLTYQAVQLADIPPESPQKQVLAGTGTQEKSGETDMETAAGSASWKYGFDGFTRAESYEEVFEAVVKWQEENLIVYDTGGELAWGAVEDFANPDAAELEYGEYQTTVTEDSGTSDYSTTNLMELGVDEGDIVKTDGKFLYVLKDSRLNIFQISGRDITEIAGIDLLEKNGSDSFQEMYVDGDRLILIVSGLKTRMLETEEDTYEVSSCPYTAAYTYSLAEPENPTLLGKVQVDGFYSTSRRNGDFLYLLTDYTPEMGTGVSDSIFIPMANGEEFPAGDMLLPEKMDSGLFLVTVSVDLNDPGKIKDRKALVGISDLVYVSAENIYVTQTDWNSNQQYTNIMKFSYQEGLLKSAGAGNVPGYLNDTFSMNEYQGYLRVVTTVWEETSVNELYVLDESMNTVGRIEDLAPGEQVYSARFLGDTGYFVTFRNMDPLFSVDLSDPENPKILGELKITGFSEYLHFWGEGKLLGIGREADPDTGEITGLKFSMFDLSDPGNVKEENKYVLGESYVSCPGLDQGGYKAILANFEKNLIGLAADGRYLVFSYSHEGGFEKLLDTELSGDPWEARGAYVNDVFYLVDSQKITLFDIAHSFEKINEINY